MDKMDCQTTSQPPSPAPQAILQQPSLVQVTQQQQQQPQQQQQITTPATAAVVTSTSPNVVAIPVVPPPEDIYVYVCVKGSLHDTNSSIFGLNSEEQIAMGKRFTKGTTEIVNGIMVNGAPVEVINTLSKLGYKVICSTGECEVVWTMQREV